MEAKICPKYRKGAKGEPKGRTNYEKDRKKEMQKMMSKIDAGLCKNGREKADRVQTGRAQTPHGDKKGGGPPGPPGGQDPGWEEPVSRGPRGRACEESKGPPNICVD